MLTWLNLVLTNSQMNFVSDLFEFEQYRESNSNENRNQKRFDIKVKKRSICPMKSRMLVLCFALMAIAGTKLFAQECATCSEAPTCDTCNVCCTRSCELFGGLKSLMACRPCIGCAPVCAAPACAAPAPCAASVSCAPVCEAPVCEAEICAPICQGPMFPYLKPALYNAVHRPINGVCKMVHGVFGTLADITTPTCDCGFLHAGCCACGEIGCAGECGACEANNAPQPCGAVLPATPNCQ